MQGRSGARMRGGKHRRHEDGINDNRRDRYAGRNSAASSAHLLLSAENGPGNTRRHTSQDFPRLPLQNGHDQLLRPADGVSVFTGGSSVSRARTVLRPRPYPVMFLNLRPPMPSPVSRTVFCLVVAPAALMMAPSAAHAVIQNSMSVARLTSAPTGTLSLAGWQYEGVWGGYMGTAVSSHWMMSGKHVG